MVSYNNATVMGLIASAAQYALTLNSLVSIESDSKIPLIFSTWSITPWLKSTPSAPDEVSKVYGVAYWLLVHFTKLPPTSLT